MPSANPIVIPYDVLIQGNLNVSGFVSLPAGSVTDAAIPAGAALSAAKIQQQYSIPYNNQLSTAAPASERRMIHRARGSGTVASFAAGMIGTVITGDATITLTLYKNGTTILSAALVLDNTNVLRVFETASLGAGATYAAGDVFEVGVVVAAGTGALGTGLAAELVVDELPQ
jgi:hypothetical protein